jgi:hypothetical protein
MNTYLIIGIAVLIVLLAIFAISKNKENRREPDYRVFFILGITWLPIGIATDNPGLWGMGAVFMVAGLANKNKWKEEPKWSELSPERRRVKMIVVTGITILLLIGIVAYIIAENN